MRNRKITKFIIMALFGVFSIAQTDAADKKPLKIYILVGQSNMQGHASSSTIPAMAWDPVSKALHDKFVDAAGKPKVYKDVQVTAVSQSGSWGAPRVDQQKAGPLTAGFGSSLTTEDRIGPELGFGVTMFEHLDEPILIIKTAWGAKAYTRIFDHLVAAHTISPQMRSRIARPTRERLSPQKNRLRIK